MLTLKCKCNLLDELDEADAENTDNQNRTQYVYFSISELVMS